MCIFCVLILYNTQPLCIIYKEEYFIKRRILINLLEEGGFVFERHGGNHDVYVRGEEREEIPRNKEINERLAKAILKRRELL